ncbi:MAG TPA: hypothetical protein VNM47_01845 [Terriglobia bacterium]|nr:hypothetical protein [Terriglobia bacterium]
MDTFVDAVNRVYSEKDGKRSIWDLWMHANHHASGMAGEIRKGTFSRGLLIEIADFTMWLFTFVHKLGGEVGAPKPPDGEQESVIRIRNQFSDLLWNKFPGCCPTCYWRRSSGGKEREGDPEILNPCDCAHNEVERLGKAERQKLAKALRSFSRRNRKLQPQGIDEWQRMFAGVFSGSLRNSSLKDLAFRLLEQMGQVSDALVRTYTYKKDDWGHGEPSWRQIFLEDELADVSCQLFTLVEKLGILMRSPTEDRSTSHLVIDPEGPAVKLSGIIWQRYGSDEIGDFICPFDGLKACGCPIIIVPSDRSVKDLRDMIDDDLPV